jgi:hypothetical protein
VEAGIAVVHKIARSVTRGSVTTGSRRPHVICHMAASLDGRIVVDGWPDSVAAAVRREYDELHSSFGADGWMCGRITMEPFAKRVRPYADLAKEYQGTAPRPDFRAEGRLASFAFAIDARGRLAWESNEIGVAPSPPIPEPPPVTPLSRLLTEHSEFRV